MVLNGSYSLGLLGNDTADQFEDISQNSSNTIIVNLFEDIFQNASDNSTVHLFQNVFQNASENDTAYEYDRAYEYEDVFQNPYIRISLIIAYTVVFICCFFGNVMVMVVVVVHQRMRTATNFFLANLALADFCVGVFCVYQNLLIYLATGWTFGDFMCRMYHFIHGLSYTASILILTIISFERYVVIVHPMWGRRVITLTRLRIVLGILWLVSGVYNSPKLFLYGTILAPWDNSDGYITLCVNKRSAYNSVQFEIYNFVFLFVMPIIIMSGLYICIGIKLWHSEKLHRKNKPKVASSNALHCCGRQRHSPRKRFVPPDIITSQDKFEREITVNQEEQEKFLSEADKTDLQEHKFYPQGALEYDSSDEEGSIDVPTLGKASLAKKVSTRKRSSFRDRSTKRGGSLKFARFHSDANPKLSSDILYAVSRPSLKIVLGDQKGIPDSTRHSSNEKDDKDLLNKDIEVSLRVDKANLSTFSGKDNYLSSNRTSIISQQSDAEDYTSASGKAQVGKLGRKGSKVLRSRRKIIRLLIAIVVTFTVFNLPYHARKFWQAWGPAYDGTSNLSMFLTISTTLVLYMNSGLNPFLYAFLSANFRRSVKEVFLCRKDRWRKNQFTPSSSSSGSRLTSLSSGGKTSQGSVNSQVSTF